MAAACSGSRSRAEGRPRGAGTVRSGVRRALHPPPGRPRRPRPPQPARRGDGHPCHARDPPRAARSRRRLRGREAVRGLRAGARPRPRRPQGARPRPAGREDRPRGADRADGLGRLEARVRPPPDRRPPLRAPGLGQDDGGGQARAPSAAAREEVARPRRRRSPASRGDRPARAARPPDPGAGLPHRDDPTPSRRRARVSSAQRRTAATS